MEDSNEITNYWTFIFIFILVIMYRGKYSYPLNPSIHNFIENNRFIMYFIFIFTTIYIFSHSLNMLSNENENENKLKHHFLYIISVFFLSILFIMFCKGNIYSVALVIITVSLIDLFEINKFSYILPILIIFISFIYEYIKFDGNFINFLET